MQILMVEDSPSDVFITQEALKGAQGLTDIHVVHDGAEAIAFLRKQPPYTDAARPDLILLDLNMPVMGGFAEKTARPPDASKRLVISGYAIMGGVEVRN